MEIKRESSIPFNKPYMTGKEHYYIAKSHANWALAGVKWTRSCPLLRAIA
jgi:hypothetical protein